MSAAAAVETEHGRTPTPEQALATAATGARIVVEAGAGSGKTSVLVARFRDAVVELAEAELERGAGADDATAIRRAARAAAEQLAAITFTEKAAAELRSRIRAELARLAHATTTQPPRKRLLAELARHRMPWVTTIHGLARRIVAAHPARAGVEPGFRVLDAGEARLLALRALDEAIAASGGEESSSLLVGVRQSELAGLVLGAYEGLRAIGVEDASLPELAGSDLGTELDSLAGAARAALATLSAGDPPPRRTKAIERLERAAALEAAEPLTPGAIANLEVLDDGERPASLQGVGADAELDAYDAALARAVEAAARPGHEALRALVRSFGERYEASKAARSGLDFEDLQLRAISVLRDHEAVARRYRDQFAELMVDEFQDTNRLQLALIDLIAGAGTTVFAVGDEHQSIYGFRHAEVELFRDRAARSDSYPLLGSFRSTPGVLAGVNLVGKALFGARFSALTIPEIARGQGSEAAAVELCAVREPPRELPDERLPAESAERGIAPARAAEAGALARRLRELVDAGEAERSGIVVLLRAFTHVDVYEEALGRAGLQPYVIGGRGYWEQQQVRDARCLLTVTANPLDDESLLGALASPACAASPDALLALRRLAGSRRHLWPALRTLAGLDEPDDDWAAEWAAALTGDDHERMGRFARVLGALREEAATLPLDLLLERLLERTGYDVAAATLPGGRRRLANARKLVAMAAEHERREGRDLRGFVTALDALGEAEVPEPEAQASAQGHDGVRVMTIHAAKGLEFDVVAVPELGEGPRGDSAAVRVRASHAGEGPRVGVRLAQATGSSVKLGAYEELRAEIKRDGEAEHDRLAYVAASRAKRRLLLSGRLADRALSGSAQQTAVLPRVLTELGFSGSGPAEGAPDPEEQSEHLTPGIERTVSIPGPGGAEAARELTVRMIEPGPGPAFSPAADEAHREREPIGALSSALLAGARAPGPPVAGHLSAGALHDYERCGYRFYVERVLGLERERSSASSPALAFGSAVHGLLERSARDGFSEPGAAGVRSALSEHGIDDAASVERARRMIAGWLGSRLCEEIRAAGAPRTEVPFVERIGPAVVRGVIDLFCGEIEGAPLVVDYKTNRLGPGGASAAMPAYETQRDTYAVAAGRSGGAVRTAFVFLEAPAEPVLESYEPERIATAEARLSASAERMAAGVYEVTDDPRPELCGDCPARGRSCPLDPAATMGKAA